MTKKVQQYNDPFITGNQIEYLDVILVVRILRVVGCKLEIQQDARPGVITEQVG